METTTPRLMAAAKEFNVGKDTLVDFLVGKGFNKDDLKPTAKLTAKMYAALEGKFVQNLAEKRIRQCLDTKNTYLDIGRCGLGDEDFREGSLLDSLLKRCTHLETLILSNSWFDEEKKGWENSFNHQESNQFTVLPAGIPALKNLEKLVCCGYSLESLYSLRRWSIKELSPLSQLINLQYLDLSHNRILTIRGLENLRRLRVLNLYSNVFTKIEGLETLAQLQNLNLSKNKITEIKGLEALTQLQELSLYNNQLTEIRGLEDLFQLQILNLSLNQLTELKGLKTLSRLQILYLHSNQLTEIKGLETLSGLQQLYLYSNQLTEIKELRNLTQLQELYLHHNHLVEIKGLKTLGQLQILDLHKNQLAEIKGLENLFQLQQLHLQDNQLAETKGLETLSELRHLNLSINQLTEIKGLEVLSKLQHLNLSNNRLINIKGLEFILRKDESFNLSIYDNPFLKEYELDLKPYENHLRFIKELLLRQNSKKRQRFIYPLKVLMLGNHGAGKSSLVNYLIGKKTKISSTHILRIENYRLQTSEKNEIPDVIFYDFGGQDFYHGLYRAFISPGSLQIIVFDNKKDKNKPGKEDTENGQDITYYNRQYWLGQKTYKEKSSAISDPYIMMQTFAGAEGAEMATPLSYDKYKGYLMSFFLSFPEQAKTEDPFFEAGRNYFKAFFEKEVRKHQGNNTTDEAQWYIDFIQFILDKEKNSDFEPTEIKSLIAGHYKAEGLSDETEKLSYLKTSLERLHQHGLVLYYREKELADIVWLNPTALIQHIKDNVFAKEKISQYSNNGIVPEKDFKNFTDDKTLAMLRQQKVVFLHEPDKNNRDKNEYIIPNFLPLAVKNDPDYQLFMFGLGNPDFIVKFNDFIPFGFINQMICFYGQQPDAKKFWRNQLLFTLHEKARVLMQLDFSQLAIKVHFQLLSDSQSDKKAITEYLFFSLIALYRDDIEDEHIPDYEAFYTYKNELNARTGIKSQPSISELLGLPHDNTYISTDMTDKTDENIWQKIYEEPDYIPEDVYISIKDKQYISYYDLVKLEQGTSRIKSYSINKETNRINREDVKEISVNPFAAFTSKNLSLMKNVFISYSHNDIEARRQLQSYVVNLEREGKIAIWQDGLLQAGDNWDQQIKESLEKADICIMLLSQSFIASNYVHEVEFKATMENRKEGKCRIIPVLVSECDWRHWRVYPQKVAENVQQLDKKDKTEDKDYQIGNFQFLPLEDGRLKPVNKWPHPEDAWLQVIETIRKAC